MRVSQVESSKFTQTTLGGSEIEATICEDTCDIEGESDDAAEDALGRVSAGLVAANRSDCDN